MEMANKLGDKKNNNKELWKIKRRSQSKQTRELNNPEGIKHSDYILQ